MRYQLDFYSHEGVMQGSFGNPHMISYARAENTVGALTAVLPLRQCPPNLIRNNYVLELWREKNGVYNLQNETAYFIQRWRVYNEDGNDLIQIWAWDANTLLEQRIVAYPAGSTQSQMSGKADDIMKQIVRDAMGATAVPERRISTVTVQDNFSASVQLTKGFSWRNVLTVLQELAESATQAGTYTCFDMVRKAPMSFEFRTYTGQRGIDHSQSSGDRRHIGQVYGNLKGAWIQEDYSEECSYVFVGGQGEEAERTIVEVSAPDNILYHGKPYNRKEQFVDGRNTEETSQLLADGKAKLREERHRKTIGGQLIDTHGLQYGRDYGFGDVITVEAYGMKVDCHVSSVELEYSPKDGERFSIKLEGELNE